MRRFFVPSAWLLALTLMAGFTVTLSGSTVVLSDTFTSASTVDLASHTPDLGTLWTKQEDTSGALRLDVAASDYLAGSGGTSGRVVYTGTPATVLGSADYDVKIDINQVVTTGTTDADPWFLVGRWASNTSYYGLGVDLNAAQTQAFLFVRTGSGTTVTVLGGGKKDVTLAAGDTFTLSMRGDTIKLLHTVSGVTTTLACAVDTTIAAAGAAGIGMGIITDPTSDVRNDTRLDNFTTTDFTGEGGDDNCGGGRNNMLLMGVS
jgi:hypothetical protein